jgi:succinate-semialdehyde dehydrogenase/glutarate-semialdehyde dehydrogenase
MKESGVGRRHGEDGILKYTEAQTVAIQRVMPLAPPRFVREETFARWMPRLLGLMRNISRRH